MPQQATDDPAEDPANLTKTVTFVAPDQKSSCPPSSTKLHYRPYTPESEALYLPAIRQLISTDLSEPYSIYVYRYFLYQWGDLCFLVDKLVPRMAQRPND